MFRRVMRDAFPLRRGEWGLGLFLYGLLTLMVAADWVGKALSHVGSMPAKIRKPKPARK